ncbi:MAG: FAD-dependent oxidoreductase [Kiritimatiellia bacterium]
MENQPKSTPSHSETAPNAMPRHFHEPARNLPLDDGADIIVAGGGPAGIAAAVTAARGGKKVRLFERQGCLGGVWTAGLLTYIFDFDKSEIGWEIIRRLDAIGARKIDRATGYDLDRDWVYEPEYMKFVCEEMCREAGVRVTLHCPVIAAYRDASGRNIEVVVTESKSGRQAWHAKQFVDCTGDGDLAALAGCGFDLGYPGLGYGQPATLNALVAVDDGDAIAEYLSNEPAMWTPVKLPDGADICHHIYASHKLKSLLREQGMEPSYGDPTLFRFHRNVFCFMANHEYRLPIDDTQAISDATMHARHEIIALAAALEKLGGPWKGFRVIGSAEQIGHREARRIHGRYTVTKDDIENGTVFDDCATISRTPIDIHGLDKKMNDQKAAGNRGNVKFRPFQIPLRCCRAKDADNLFMAGRNISGDFYAHASYRVTGSSVALGEAVGRFLSHQ